VGRQRLATALAAVQAMTATMINYLMAAQQDPTELYKVGLGSVRFLITVGDLVIGWKLLQQAEIAAQRTRHRRPRGRKFYEGKVANALFFTKTILPEVSASRAVIDDVDNDIMTV
jgi:Acetyl-CoA dehydrogenase C-terminal like